jgi:hypothetical protein
VLMDCRILASGNLISSHSRLEYHSGLEYHSCLEISVVSFLLDMNCELLCTVLDGA